MSHSSRRPGPTITICLFCAAVITGFCALVAILGNHITNLRAFQWAYAGAYVAYLTTVWVLIRRRGKLPGRWTYWMIFIAAIRIIPINSAPSDDAYRYVWEGRIQLAGHNPFATSPDDPILEPLRTTPDWDYINHKSYTAIYPPLAQFLFRITAAIHPSVTAVKIMTIFFDLLTIFIITRWMVAAGKRPDWAVLYALNPLVLTAFAIEGHLDSIMLACIAAFGWMCTAKNWTAAALFLAAAISAKTVAAVLLGWLAIKKWWAALATIVLVAASYYPFADAGDGLLRSLMRFSTEQDFFTLFYPWLTMLTPPDIARWISATTLLLILAWWLRRKLTVAEYAGRAFGALVLLMPVVHIWYVTWPLLLQPFRARWSWLILGGTMVFYFEAKKSELAATAWSLPTWTVWATYGPFLLVWLMERCGVLDRDGFIREEEDQKTT
jgi:hypothetical protein